MSEHLTSEQIVGFVAGDAGSDPAGHLRECGECRKETERLRDTLLVFRNSVRDWSHHTGGHQPRYTSIVTKRRTLPLRWPLATAALGIVALIPMYKSAREQRLEAQIAQDTLLLADIDARLSRRVPLAMEPLMELFATEPGHAGENGSEEDLEDLK